MDRHTSSYQSAPSSPVNQSYGNYPAPLSPYSYQSQQNKAQQRPSLVRTVLNLTGCVIGVAGSICYEVTSYWAKVKKYKFG